MSILRARGYVDRVAPVDGIIRCDLRTSDGCSPARYVPDCASRATCTCFDS